MLRENVFSTGGKGGSSEDEKIDISYWRSVGYERYN